jgi:putative ABC transport system permease protein
MSPVTRHPSPNMNVLLRLGLRYTRKHLLQSLLLVLGVALGVAVIIAIDLANLSAMRAFRLSSESLTGRATHQVTGPRTGINESFYYKLRVELGIRNSAPVVEDFVTVRELNNKPLRVFGVDPFAEPPFRNYVADRENNVKIGSLNRFLTEPGTALVEESLAGKWGLKENSVINIEYGTSVKKVKIAGILKANDDFTRQALSGLLITDISTAQELLNKTGKLSHIDLIIDPNTAPGKSQLEKIKKILEPGLQIELPGTRSAALEQMSHAFELNLSALSLLALVVGMFLIYNTVTFSVVQRRNILGILRSLGVTREQVFSMVTGETAVLGALGTILGLGLGILLGNGALYLVTQTINDLYYTLTVTDIHISWFTLFKGMVIGILASVAASAAPALEATRVPPVGVLRRSLLESRIKAILPWVSLGGLLLGLLGTILLFLPGSRIDISFIGLFTIIIGSSLLVPVATALLMKLISPLSTLLAGVIGRMAPRNITRSLSRTTVAIAALMVAVSVIVGVSIMIGSFRQTVVNWLDSTLNADIFIAAPSAGAGINAGSGSSLVKMLENYPGIEKIATARNTRILTPGYGIIQLSAVSSDIARNRRFVWTDGSPADVRAQVKAGKVMVSESFAYHNKITRRPGNKIELPTPHGNRTFAIAAIYYDYSSDRGTVFIDAGLYRKLWNDYELTSIAVFIPPGQDINKMIENLEKSFGKKYSLLIQSNRSLRESALVVFDRTFAITAALRLLAGAVAFIGVFSTLMSLQLERLREFGILRATGMTTGQVQGMIMLETGLMGLTAGLLAMPVGIILALILIHVINLRSFGWSLELILLPGYFIQAIAVSVTASLLAGIYPALRLKNIQAAHAIRTE